MYNEILNRLHEKERKCNYIQMLVNAIASWLDVFNYKLVEFYSNFYFDSLTYEGVLHYEKLLAITPTKNQSLENRRAKIHSKWLSNNHNSIKLIQTVCNAWKNGEVIADFKNGKIQITFVGSFGVPDDLDSLKLAIGEVKPAHIGFEIIYKYLLIENIHEVMTIEDLEKITLEQFAFGAE